MPGNPTTSDRNRRCSQCGVADETVKQKNTIRFQGTICDECWAGLVERVTGERYEL